MVHTGLQNEEEEAGSRGTFGGFTPFLGTQTPSRPNPSAPGGLGVSLGRGVWVLGVSYDPMVPKNPVCRSRRLGRGAGRGTWLWTLSTPLVAGSHRRNQTDVGERAGWNRGPQMPQEYKRFWVSGENSRMVSLLTSRFSHFSKRAVSAPDCIGRSLTAWESLDPSLGVGGWGGVGAVAAGELTSEL